MWALRRGQPGGCCSISVHLANFSPQPWTGSNSHHSASSPQDNTFHLYWHTNTNDDHVTPNNYSTSQLHWCSNEIYGAVFYIQYSTVLFDTYWMVELEWWVVQLVLHRHSGVVWYSQWESRNWNHLNDNHNVDNNAAVGMKVKQRSNSKYFSMWSAYMMKIRFHYLAKYSLSGRCSSFSNS